MTLQQFLQGAYRNAWVWHGTLEVYVRHDAHYAGGTLTNFLTIANVVNRATTGKGDFWRMITAIERWTTLPIRVEQVLNPRLAASLRSRGWVEYQPYNFYTEKLCK